MTRSEAARWLAVYLAALRAVTSICEAYLLLHDTTSLCYTSAKISGDFRSLRTDNKMCQAPPAVSLPPLAQGHFPHVGGHIRCRRMHQSVDQRARSHATSSRIKQTGVSERNSFAIADSARSPRSRFLSTVRGSTLTTQMLKLCFDRE